VKYEYFEGANMTGKYSTFFTGSFFFFFFAFMAVHYAYMKTPAQDRSIASEHSSQKPWYDASWKN
jgi:hypothetical protein